MDSFEWNKIAAAVLVGMLIFMGVNLVTESVFKGEEDIVEGPAKETVSSEPPAEEMTGAATTFYALLVDASVEQGARSFRKCQACHIVTEGGGNRIGPNLFGVVGRPVASVSDYTYSSAMTGEGGTWTFDALNEFLTSPATAVAGTKMSFAGIRNEEERANLIAYLRAQSASPLPLPEVPAAAPAGEETPGE